LFALMFGQFIEEKAAELKASGAPALDAATRAVSGVLTEQAQRVQIPKKIGLDMRDIYWNQQRFAKREGKYPRYFLRRPGFADAWEYFRFTSEVTGENRELRAWWKEFIKANPLTPGEEKEVQKGAERKARPKRRRRRRGGSGSRSSKPETHKPKT
ncbi:MAG TPA: poly(A) polymerase, partial [Nitrospirota bacterium]|nr:poly(A) polymerase [Nitrospirota bacterium]